jgi:adenylate cyclase class IV
MSTYREREVKIIDINVADLQQRIQSLGAKKVFDGDRVFTYFDYADGRLRRLGEEVRLTEEEKLKLSFSRRTQGEKETIKVFVSRKQEIVDFLDRLGLRPIAAIPSHRVSYEWGTIDFDIDVFPRIPSFIEVDLGESPQLPLEDLLNRLNIQGNERSELGTHEIYAKFGIDVFQQFRLGGKS